MAELYKAQNKNRNSNAAPVSGFLQQSSSTACGFCVDLLRVEAANAVDIQQMRACARKDEEDLILGRLQFLSTCSIHNACKPYMQSSIKTALQNRNGV